MNEPMTNEQADFLEREAAVIAGNSTEAASAFRAGAAALRRVDELEADHNALAVTLANEIAEKVKIRRDHEALRAQLDAIRAEAGEEPRAIHQDIDGVRAELESRGWQLDTKGDMDCCDEASAAGADAIVALIHKHRANHLALKYIELREAAQALSTALEGAFISSWQSTASWDKQKDALAELLARGK